MALVEQARLAAKLAPPLDKALVDTLIDEFVATEKRYLLRDWKPAELDGGQFAEVLGRIIYHQDSGNLNLSKDLDECLTYLANDKMPHNITPRYHALHIGRVLRTIYKLRSQRGAIHISPLYTANRMDAKLILECVRWAMLETLRLYLKVPQEEAATIIEELLRFDVPCVGRFGDQILVQRTDLTAEQEILVLLHYAGQVGFTRTELGKYAKCSAASVSKVLKKLISPSLREVAIVGSRYCLTDLGSKRVRETLPLELA